MSPERDAAAYRECTRDPIFLFQRRRWNLVDVPEGHELCAEGAVYPKDRPDADALTVDELKDLEAVVTWWETESVWLSREEAEDYGRRRAYNYRDGWRVFCVCAEGRLGELLQEHA